MEKEYHGLKENLSDKALKTQKDRQELADKIRYLTIQLGKAVADFDLRMESFLEHTDHIRKIISSTQKMKKAFDESRIDDFEKYKKELRAQISKLREETRSVQNNILIEKSDKDIIIRFERSMEHELEDLEKIGIKDYKLLNEEQLTDYETIREKVSQYLKEDKQAIDSAANAIQVIKKIIDLIEILDTILLRLSSIVKKEEEILSKLHIEPGKSIDPIDILGIESHLAATLREMFTLLKEEKTLVHDPFLRFIDHERSGIHEALKIIDKKRIPWWRRLGKKSPKITYDDITRTMQKFTEQDEYLTFFSSLLSHPELVDDSAKRRLGELFKTMQRQFKSLKGEIYNDALTKLRNRRFRDEFVKDMLQRKKEFSILAIDIDHFKDFNDTYGHDVGDKVLKDVADSIKENIKITDVAARWGGEEIMVIFPRTELEGAFKASERIRESIEHHKMTDFNGNPVRQITISGGVVHVSEKAIESLKMTKNTPAEMMDRVFKFADELLYKAKHEGRNRIYSSEFVVTTQ